MSTRRGALGTASAAVLLSLVAAASANAPAEAQQQAIRICDERGCSMRAADYTPADEAAAERAAREDNDTYQGEPLQQLWAEYQAGDVAAAYKLGIVSQYGIGGRKIDLAQAETFLNFAASHGHIWAQYRLASLLSSGQGRRDPAKALELFFAAARGGQPQSANNVGLAYLKGEGLPRDVHQAIRWLSIAADGGVPEAQYNLGVIYLRGQGDTQDLYQGLKLTKAAADAGQIDAKKAIGRIHMTGLNNVRQDLREAKRYLEPVAAKGDKEARAWLAEIRETEERDEAHAQEMAKQNAEIFKFLGGVALATMLAPPPVYVVTP